MAPRRLLSFQRNFLNIVGVGLRTPRGSSVIAAGVVFVVDCLTPADFVVGVFYIVAMVLAAQTRSRSWLAGIGAASILLTMLAGFVGAPSLPGTSDWTMLTNRALTDLALLGPLLMLDQMVRAQLREDVLRHEVDHRAKNILAAITALLRLVPRDDPARFARMVEARVHAMARVHSLLAEERWEGADLGALVRMELAPYASSAGQMRFEGPPVRLKADVAQPLGMVLHELAMNSAKYGAFSNPKGWLSLHWRIDQATAALVLEWTEMDGPEVEGPPERSGFGTRLLAKLAKQIGGSVESAWQLSGLRCVIKVPSRSYAPSA